MNHRLNQLWLFVAQTLTCLAVLGCGGASNDEISTTTTTGVLEEAEHRRWKRIDKTPPSVAVTASKQVGLTGQTELNGTASDDKRLFRVRWASDRGGRGEAVLSGTTTEATWTVASIQLSNGANTITMTAEDAAGNSTSTSTTITRTDGPAPAPVPVPSTPPPPVPVPVPAPVPAPVPVPVPVPVPAPIPAPAPGTAPTPSASASCGTFYNAAFQLVSGKVTPAVPSMAKPAKGVVYSEPAFQTCAVRVTDHAAEAPSGFARNDYSRRQAFNADSSLMLVYALDGFWHVYDANTYAYVKRLAGPAADAEPQWDPIKPNLLYYVPTNGGMVVNELNVSTNTSRVVGNFAGRLPWGSAARLWTKSEGSPSADARYWAFMAETNSFSPVGIVVWDKDTDTIVSTLDNSNRPDHLSMSASGNYVVVSWNEGVVAFTRDLKTRKPLNVLGEHSDIALDANGDDQYVSVDYQSNEGMVYMLNLRTGVRIDLFPTYINGSATALHISGKAFRKPGWVVLSAYANYGGNGAEWLHRKVSAVQLQANPKIYQLAHTRVSDQGYWTEPHASVNRDFTKIVFNSNWGAASAENVDAYMIELPAGIIK